ncbi:MAG: acetylxylan esterase [Pirellulales bacterium]|nr:acetylxylan esterase [Pirellulales bacterium]
MSTIPSSAHGQNYEEAKVPEYTLPDPLVAEDGESVRTADQWFSSRRKEILELFRREVYGRIPPTTVSPQLNVTEQGTPALDGSALRRQVTIRLGEEPSSPKIDLLIYYPAHITKATPAFVGLNFIGNQSIQADPQIKLCENWTIGGEHEGVVDHRPTEASRGKKASRWPVKEIVRRGYAVATAHCGDLDPDFDDSFKNGVHALFGNPSQKNHDGDSGGTIAAWSWGLSRIMDYFEHDAKIDHRRVAVVGHSRLGKTALWTGARDPRFAAVISNNSGCGGAALSRRQFGETVEAINTNFPHWFCTNFKTYNRNESALPVDQHMLLSLIAPRPVYVASATEDLWADPQGEFLAVLAADPVYKLLGTEGFPSTTKPKPDESTQATMGYHLRTGPHDVRWYDWQQYLDFADHHFQSTDAKKKKRK